MSNYQVINVSATTMTKMKAAYMPYLVKKNISHINFVAKIAGTTITAYFSGKVLFQGSTASDEAAKWSNLSSTATDHIKEKKNHGLPKDFVNWSVIGSDEVGNGSYFGPITVCATYVSKEMIPQLKTLGVRDSKTMNDEQIKQLAETIKSLIPYQLLVVTPKKYNRVQPKYNAVHMKVVLHNQVIYLLLKKIAPEKPEAILIDQFTPEANYKKYVLNEKNQVYEKIFFMTKGEQHHLAVAAASIISRAAFLEELAKESQEIGMHLPSGAGSKSDQVAAKILNKGGVDLLTHYAKVHFANTKKAQKLSKLI